MRFFFACAVLFFADAAFAFEDLDQLAAEGNKIVLASKRIELPDFPGAFNPSIIETERGYLMTFRYAPDVYGAPSVSYIGVVFLDDKMEPVGRPQLLSTRPKKSKTPSQSEDARIFSYRGRLFLIYNDNLDVVNPRWHNRRDMFIAELFYEEGRFSLSAPLKLLYEEKRHVLWQKNWMPFLWKETLLLTYSANPHEVIYPNLANGSCYHCYETKAPIDWPWGQIRGGTAALLVDGRYLTFFHSGIVMATPISWDWEIWHYFMGACTFAAEPPFQMTAISPKPIVADGFYTASTREKRVIFPGGFIVKGSTIWLVYGKDDCEIWVAALDKEALFNSLEPVESPP